MRRAPLVLLILVLAAIAALSLELWRRRGEPADGVELVDVRADVERRIAERGAVETGPGLTRVPLDEETARDFFAALRKGEDTRNVYDPLTYFENRPGFVAERTFREHPAGGWTIRFNAAGFKRGEEIAVAPPDLRVLVAGDSHSEGVVPTPENYCSRLEALLEAAEPGRSAEVLNASRGGYMLYNYLGVLEKHAELDPRVFVMAVFGGNDFAETVPLYGYFEGESIEDEREKWGLKVAYARRENRGSGAALAQGMHQEAIFHHSPRWRELAREAVVAVGREVARQCDDRGIELVVLYIPPATDAQPQHCAEGIAGCSKVFEMTPEDRGWTERIADAFLDAMRGAGATVVDLRPAFRASDERLYWNADLHINTAGHRVAAEELFGALGGVLADRRR